MTSLPSNWQIPALARRLRTTCVKPAIGSSAWRVSRAVWPSSIARLSVWTRPGNVWRRQSGRRESPLTKSPSLSKYRSATAVCVARTSATSANNSTCRPRNSPNCMQAASTASTCSGSRRASLSSAASMLRSTYPGGPNRGRASNWNRWRADRHLHVVRSRWLVTGGQNTGEVVRRERRRTVSTPRRHAGALRTDQPRRV